MRRFTMKRYVVQRVRWVVLPLGLGVLLLLVGGLSVGLAQQRTDCRTHVPAVGSVLNTRALPFIINFDPCSNRLTMTDDALKPTGGPYIGKAEAERRALGVATPTKVRSYFGRYDDMHSLIGLPGATTDIYPDREVWLVVVQARDQGPMPSLKAGIEPWPRRWYYRLLDATTGRLLEEGGNGRDDLDWPARLPVD